MSLAGTAAAIVIWLTEVRRARLDTLTTWTLLVPIFGIILSVVVLQERQSIWGWIGTVVVIASTILVTVTTRQRTHTRSTNLIS
ncbi:hypothetical protein E3O06_07160 [Cryobacterium glaciale]|uniref:EamA domain-containing protein n=2 Tax=Cryobacterium glaciale TaxID=1259145 RepID=A0A4R8UZY9_9MICO|nr:hypothetical protein E3O06_07160 [Cryobacterium glaciale]